MARPDPRLVVVVAALFAVGALLILAIHVVHGIPAERRGRDWIKYGVYVALINGLLAAAFAGRAVVGTLLAIIATAGAVEVWHVLRPRFRAVAATGAWVGFACSLATPVIGPEPGWRDGFAFLLMLTATSDSFGELVGRLIGRTKAFPHLSPGKTIEGTVAGMVCPVVVAWLLGFLVPWATGIRLALLGLAVAAGAMSGDLLFSAVKRAVGVKDFSGVLPGHGGVLDRFDSLLVAAPVYAVARAWMGAG